MKKFWNFFGLCFYAIGAIGGFGYAMYSKAYFIASCVIVLVVLAFPEAKKMFKDMMNIE